MFNNAKKTLAQRKANLTAQNLTKVAYNYFVKVTPIDTGNARNKTKLNGNQIDAQYPYAQRLDRGWSRQAPKGMTKPTIDYLRRYIQKQITGK